MRIWPRRKPAPPPPPVVLPSLDRLAGLIERVVELVDEVSGGPVVVPEPKVGPPQALPAPPAPQPRPQPQPASAQAASSDGPWVAFVGSPHGYTLVELAGAPPAPGNELEIDGARYRAVRYAPSPLPGDGRRCVVVEMEEPPKAERSSDA